MHYMAHSCDAVVHSRINRSRNQLTLHMGTVAGLQVIRLALLGVVEGAVPRLLELEAREVLASWGN